VLHSLFERREDEALAGLSRWNVAGHANIVEVLVDPLVSGGGPAPVGNVCGFHGRVVFRVQAVGDEPAGFGASVFDLDPYGLDPVADKIEPEELPGLLPREDVGGHREVAIRSRDGVRQVAGFVKRLLLKRGVPRQEDEEEDQERVAENDRQPFQKDNGAVAGYEW